MRGMVPAFAQAARVAVSGGEGWRQLAALSTGIYMLIALVFPVVTRRLPRSATAISALRVRYPDGRGQLRQRRQRRRRVTGRGPAQPLPTGAGALSWPSRASTSPAVAVAAVSTGTCVCRLTSSSTASDGICTHADSTRASAAARSSRLT
jgi:hypothetical protein